MNITIRENIVTKNVRHVTFVFQYDTVKVYVNVLI
jgi:hypothetical protein